MFAPVKVKSIYMSLSGRGVLYPTSWRPFNYGCGFGYTIKQNYDYTVETGLLAHDALLGSIAELYTLIFENAPIMQSIIPGPTQKPDVSVIRADSQAG